MKKFLETDAKLERGLVSWWQRLSLLDRFLYTACVLGLFLVAISLEQSCDADCQRRRFAEELIRCQAIMQPKTQVEALTFGWREIREAQKCVDDLARQQQQMMERARS